MKNYRLELLIQAYRKENPNLSETDVQNKAKQMHSCLNTLDVRWKRSNRRFYHNTNLSGSLFL